MSDACWALAAVVRSNRSRSIKSIDPRQMHACRPFDHGRTPDRSKSIEGESRSPRAGSKPKSKLRGHVIIRDRTLRPIRRSTRRTQGQPRSTPAAPPHTLTHQSIDHDHHRPTHVHSNLKMETILLRRRHREGQALGLVRAAVREVESRTTTDTTAAEGGAEGTKEGGKRGGMRTLEALHGKVRCWDMCA